MFIWLRQLFKIAHHHSWEAETRINADGIMIVIYYYCAVCGEVRNTNELQDNG